MTTLTPDDLVEYTKEKETLSRNEKINKTINNPMSSISTKHTLLKQTLKSKSTSSLVSSPSSTICKSKSNFFKTQCKTNKIQLPKLKIRSSSSLNIFNQKGRNKNSQLDLISLTSLYGSYININNDKEDDVRIVSKRKRELEKIYQINDEYAKKQKIIKRNNEIAFRKDFDIEKYQNMLLSFTGMKARRDLIVKMRRDFIDMRKRIVLNGEEYKFKQKNRWDSLAEKVENFVPMFLVNRLNDLSKIKLNEIKKRYEKINVINRKYTYNRKCNKEVNVFNKKKNENKSDDANTTNMKKEEE